MGMLMSFEYSGTGLVHNLNHVAYIAGSCNLLNASLLVGFFGRLALGAETDDEKESDSPEYLAYYTDCIDRKNKILLQEFWFQDAFGETKIQTSSFNTVTEIVISKQLLMGEQDIDLIKPGRFIGTPLASISLPGIISDSKVTLGDNMYTRISFQSSQINALNFPRNLTSGYTLPNFYIEMVATQQTGITQQQQITALNTRDVKQNDDRTILLLDKAVKTIIPSSRGFYKRVKIDSKIRELQMRCESRTLFYLGPYLYTFIMWGASSTNNLSLMALYYITYSLFYHCI
jgi:hypothetical protein